MSDDESSGFDVPESIPARAPKPIVDEDMKHEPDVDDEDYDDKLVYDVKWVGIDNPKHNT